jgi:capsular polysaccharide biosynthesis protein
MTAASPEVRLLNAKVQEITRNRNDQVQNSSLLDVQSIPAMMRRYADDTLQERVLSNVVSYLKSEQAEAQANLEGHPPMFDVLDAAPLPKAPFEPNKKAMVMLGFAVGVAASFLILIISSFLVEARSYFLRNRIRQGVSQLVRANSIHV